MKKTKNIYVELLRIMFIGILLIHHSGNMLDEGQTNFFTNGAFAVEFFFMLSGYFTLKHINKVEKSSPESLNNPMEYSMKYTFNKLLRILPYAAVGILLAYLFHFIWPLSKDAKLIDKILAFRTLPYELTFMPMTGIMLPDLFIYQNAPLWYLSCMFIVLPLITYLSIKHKDIFKWWICLFVPALLYSYIIINWGHLFVFNLFSVLVYGGVIRAFADLTMGFGIAYLSDALKEKEIKKPVKILLTILEALLLLYVVYCCHIILTGYDEIFIVYCIATILLLNFSGLTYSSCIKLPEKLTGFVTYLGELTTPVYCIHWAISLYITEWFDYLPYLATFAINVVAVILISVICKKLIKK